MDITKRERVDARAAEAPAGHLRLTHMKEKMIIAIMKTTNEWNLEKVVVDARALENIVAGVMLWKKLHHRKAGVPGVEDRQPRIFQKK